MDKPRSNGRVGNSEIGEQVMSYQSQEFTDLTALAKKANVTLNRHVHPENLKATYQAFNGIAPLTGVVEAEAMEAFLSEKIGG